MKTELFDYELPDELIAARPPEFRDGGRMCVLEQSAIRHGLVKDFPKELRANDLVVLNETRVRRARLNCRRPLEANGGGGAKVELLFLHPRGDDSWSALGKANRPLRVGDRLESAHLKLTISGRELDGTLHVHVDGDLEAELLLEGTMPIPPYMNRTGDAEDVNRYQTVFATDLGSAAAPTAGLHLTTSVLESLPSLGVEVARLTLHVGVGTFRPVSAKDLDDHLMHSEEIEVGEELSRQVEEARQKNGRVIAIGTTAVRALESAADPARPGHVRPTKISTNLLIQPGYEFQVTDALWTNFHQPRSTLMALVSAFIGLDRVKVAYKEAVAERYRFLSYGDAMWIPTPRNSGEAGGEKT